MARKLKRSDWVFLGSLAVGVLIGGGAWLKWPGAPWWVYAGGGFIVTAIVYSALIEHFANVAMIDQDRD
jgi:hypothetical protein